MSSTLLMSSSALELAPSSAARPSAAIAAEPGAWRFRMSEEKVAGLSWVVAIAASFLIVGIAGLFQVEAPLDITLGGAPGVGEDAAASTEVTIAELHAMEEAPAVSEEAITPEMVDLVQPTEILPDLPELAEVVPLEDAFTVPAAPAIEDALRPVDPAPKPQPKPAPRAAPQRRTTAAATSNATGSRGSSASGSGGGGSGTVGAGAGRGRFPEPPYPSSARSRGVSGSIKLALSISASGVVTSAAAISSQGGFTSGEQDAVAGYVRRNWRFSTGTPLRHTVNIVFRLTSR